jgi:Holliday junction resolvase RusA-like endonuclease
MQQTFLVIELPLPRQAVNPNARVHHMVKAKATASQRAESRIATLAAMNAAGFAIKPYWRTATVQATFYKPDARVKSDADNSISSLKAVMDGIQDAGLIANDQGLTWLPTKQLIGKEADGERKLMLVITKE